MTSGDEKSREGSPGRSTRGRARSSSSRPRIGPANAIEFVDSQDPNVKSAIQRHTAYHSAAQRRETRLQSLRRGRQTRYLDWGRRQGTEACQPMSPESSSSSAQTTPGIVLPATDRSLSRQSSADSSIPPLSPAEEALLQFYIDRLTQQHSDGQPYETAINYMLLDEGCTQLLIAYCHSLRATLQEAAGVGEPDRQAAPQYLARGTNILRNRLRDSHTASSDANIQAVLLLVSYTSDFVQSDSEMNIHADALRTMVAERGGIEALSGNEVLHHQLIAADTARKYHLTLDCSVDCPKDLRFPDGFWPARS